MALTRLYVRAKAPILAHSGTTSLYARVSRKSDKAQEARAGPLVPRILSYGNKEL